MGVVSYGFNELLDAQLSVFVERWAVGSLGGVLNFFSVVDWSVPVRGVMRFLEDGVVKLDMQIGDVFFHCEAAGALVVVPLEVDTHVKVAFIAEYYVVVIFYGMDQVIGVALAYILDAEIINYKDEHGWLPLVAP